MCDIKLKVYEQLCNSYRAIDDFRAKLLTLLPLATGGGIFLLVGGENSAKDINPYLSVIGLFGFVATLGLSFLEVGGILKCERLIKSGAELEKNLCIKSEEGQFLNRRWYANLKPFAFSIIYPAVLAAQGFLAFDFKLCQNFSYSDFLGVDLWASCIFLGGFAILFTLILWIISQKDCKSKLQICEEQVKKLNTKIDSQKKA